MELEEVKVGRVDWVSHWFENSRISDEMRCPGNERTWPWKHSNHRIGRDLSDENSVVSTEMKQQKRASHNA
jgi:hypothetical protein